MQEFLFTTYSSMLPFIQYFAVFGIGLVSGAFGYLLFDIFSKNYSKLASESADISAFILKWLWFGSGWSLASSEQVTKRAIED